ncbi:MAG: NAD-dependent epimerase/dehydratase family protein [Bacteroidota bacterium]
MKKYVITGGAGFLGSHIAKYLSEEGHHVIILDSLRTGF